MNKKLRKLFNRANASFRSRLSIPTPLVEAEILGRTLRVHYGSVRTSPDYDDAWLLACAFHSKHVETWVLTLAKPHF